MYRSFFDVCSLTSEYVNSFDSAMVGSGGEVLVCVCVAEGCLCAVGSECVDSGRRRRRRIAEGGSTGVNWKFRDGETRVYGGSGERMLFVHL